MDRYREQFALEKAYLEKTIQLLKQLIRKEQQAIDEKRSELRAERRDMGDKLSISVKDPERLLDINQFLSDDYQRLASISLHSERAHRYAWMLHAPYFARIDFREEGYPPEKIYIGLHSVVDDESDEILVYDWRTPVCSLFYQHETGPASYQAPYGEIKGEVLLKRHFKIEGGQLRYYVDCDVSIRDMMLMEALSRNASPQMRQIVTTIQREQDKVIRDTKSDLLMVQGSAGSGKTIIALHRIAYLLYHGLKNALRSEDVLILSPSGLYGEYISHVLPELGETTVRQLTFDELAASLLGGRPDICRRREFADKMIECPQGIEAACYAFKSSEAFVRLLDRYVDYFERRLIPFEDVWFDGCVVAKRELLKSSFLNNPIRMPAAKRLARMERRLFDRIHPIQKRRLERREQILSRLPGHENDYKKVARYYSILESSALRARMSRFTKIDCLEAYRRLFEKRLIRRLKGNIALPRDIDSIIEHTRHQLQCGRLAYDDVAPMLYLKLRLEGASAFGGIRQVVIDEAQDYAPIHYHIFGLLFQNAAFTVLGDTAQSLFSALPPDFYDGVAAALKKKRTTLLKLLKTYRSSYEITAFARRLLGPSEVEVFERHENPPSIYGCRDEGEQLARIAARIKEHLAAGFESVAVICKTGKRAAEVYEGLKGLVDIALIDEDGKLQQGASVLSVLTAKGMEFDAVIICDLSETFYSTENDRRLLYVACTRALHRLDIFYGGKPSPLII